MKLSSCCRFGEYVDGAKKAAKDRQVRKYTHKHYNVMMRLVTYF